MTTTRTDTQTLSRLERELERLLDRNEATNLAFVRELMAKMESAAAGRVVITTHPACNSEI